jgi:hypothetical protein
MRRVISHAAPFVPWMRAGGSRLRQWGSWREVPIQANGRAAWRAETMKIVCDFSAADGFRRDAHIDIRREAQRQTRRDAGRNCGQAPTSALCTTCHLDGRPCLRALRGAPGLARVVKLHPSGNEGWQGGGGRLSVPPALLAEDKNGPVSSPLGVPSAGGSTEGPPGRLV